MLTVTLKGLWAHKRRLVGMLTAVVLGVGFLAGALALGDTLSSNFDKLFASANAGTDAVVRSATTVGTGFRAARPAVDVSLAATMRGVPGVAAAEPAITGFGEILGSDGAAIGGNGPPRLASYWLPDPVLNPYRLAQGRAPATPEEIVVNRGAATAGKLRLGQTVTVLMPAPVRARIVGIATFAGTDGLGRSTMAAFNLAGAERNILGITGGLDGAGGAAQASSIVVRAQPGVSQAELTSRIQKVLPANVDALTGVAATQQAVSDISGTFLTALRTVLVVFAGIALLVATLSIANTFAIVVAQRSREAALLRALGGTRRQLLGSVVVEALCIGALASGLGLLAGLGIAGLLKGLFDSFGFALPAGGLVVSGTSVIVSVLAGMVVTLGAGLLPALRASRIAPLAAFRGAAAESTTPSLIRAIVGGVLAAGGAILVVAGIQAPTSQVLSVVGIGALLTTVGVVALGAVVAKSVTGLIGRPLAAWRGTPGLLARGNAMRSPRRSAAAATALMVGVAIVTLFTVYAASLKTASDNGVKGSFNGDLAITSGSFGPGTLSPELVAAIGGLPGVRTATGISEGQALIAGKAQQVSSVDPAHIGTVLDLHPAAGSMATLNNSQIAVSQHEASNRGWQLGTALPATMPDGAKMQLSIGAIYTSRDLTGDYVVPLGLWTAHNRQVVDSVVFVKLAPEAGLAAAKAAVTTASAPYGQPTVNDRAAFIASAGQGVSLILGIVYVLLALAVIIAILGITNTLTLAIHERTREIGMLRAVGQTRRQLRSMIRLESVIVSVFGVLGGLALGTFLGWGLAEATNKAQGFATFTLPVARIGVILALGALAGILAAVRPARRAARLPVLGAMATE
jgi:putative ABC transport system permease protein